MAKKSDDKNQIGKVDRTTRAKGVSQTESVDEVHGVSKTSSVSGVNKVGAVERTGNNLAISLAQKDRLLRIVGEEAEKLAKQGMIPPSQRSIVEKAVKMVIDAAAIEDDARSKKK